MNFKRLLIIADLHCGHRVGLTPPKYMSAIPGEKFYRIQNECWEKYTEWIDAINKDHVPDLLIVNGDATEGKGNRSGGNELLTTDRIKQARMAAECIDYCKAKEIRLVRGTPYHTGVDEDFENVIVSELGIPNKNIEDYAWLDINGVIFSIRHFVNSSSIPHGRFTALARNKLWNIIWNNEHELQPDANFIVRSHVHYCVFCGEGTKWQAITTPALQAAATKYGALRCEGMVHFGLLYYDIYSDGRVEEHKCIKPVQTIKVIPTVV